MAVAVHHPQPIRQLAAPLPRGTRRLCLLAASCLRCGCGRGLGCCLQLGLVQVLQLEPQPDPPRAQTNLRGSTTKQQAPLSYVVSRYVTCVLSGYQWGKLRICPPSLPASRTQRHHHPANRC